MSAKETIFVMRKNNTKKRLKLLWINRKLRESFSRKNNTLKNEQGCTELPGNLQKT